MSVSFEEVRKQSFPSCQAFELIFTGSQHRGGTQTDPPPGARSVATARHTGRLGGRSYGQRGDAATDGLDRGNSDSSVGPGLALQVARPIRRLPR